MRGCRLALILWAVALIPLAEPSYAAPGETTEAAGPSEAPETEPADPRRAARGIQKNRRVLSAKENTLIDRPDLKRPNRRLTVPFLGLPITVGGRYELRIDAEQSRLNRFDFFRADTQDVDMDGDLLELRDRARGRVPIDDRVDVNQVLLLDLFLPITKNISVFVSGSGAWRNLVKADHLSEGDEWEATYKESWLYLGDLFDTPFALQIGRQNFDDDREWWWDDNLDAIRVRFDNKTFHAEIGVTEQLVEVSTLDDFIDPENEDILRVLGSVNWEWSRKQQIAIYALYQYDHSDGHVVGECDLNAVELAFANTPPQFQNTEFFRNLIASLQAGCLDAARTDESDANLTWVGVSAEGRWKLGRAGRLHYWANVAGVFGDETFFDFTGNSLNRRVGIKSDHRVEGWGIDAWLTWQTELLFRPRVTVGYAYGTGDSEMQEETDTGFRQTGLEGNTDKWLGVDSFHYYGELFDPELSNLHVITAALGFPFFKKSSVELVYHYYRQAHAASFLRNSGIKRRPNGTYRTIGHEWDVILGIEEWGILEIEVIGSAFVTGAAFEPKKGKTSYKGVFQARLNF